MAAPTITAFLPGNNETDVVLGSQILVTFDQVLDHTTVNDSTFSLTCPGGVEILTPERLTASEPQSVTGREYIPGVFSFDDSAGYTVVTFNPNRPLQPNVEYTVLLMGGDGMISSDAIKNAGGEALATSYQWKFRAGDLNISAPPVISPIPPDFKPHLDPAAIQVLPRRVVGNDLAQEIILVFPGNIDPASFRIEDLLVSVEPILGDPNVLIPAGLQTTARVEGNKLRILITGWPSDGQNQ